MVALKLFLQISTWVIFALFGLIILYFPVIELVAYVARETRFFKTPYMLPIEDALLPLFCLAVAYAAIATLMRKIEKPEPAGDETPTLNSD